MGGTKELDMNSDVQITTANNYIHPSRLTCMHTYCCPRRVLGALKNQDSEVEDKPCRFSNSSRQIMKEFPC